MPAFQRTVRAALLAFAAAIAAASGATADQAALVALPFSARDLGPQPMACTVETAHFFSVDLGTAQPGGTVTQAFRADPASGTVLIRNARGDLMPVQSLWCGIAGRAWVTRFTFALPRKSDRRPPALHFACRSNAAALRCEALPSRIAPGPR